jgi:hypothetical protein
MSSTRDMPDTMAEKRKTIGIKTLDHQGLALIDPKIKPTYPCNRKAEGIPITVIIFDAFLSKRIAFSEVSVENKDNIR